MPIKVFKDEIVFGMDSGIARGGIGVYYPNSNHWNFIFFKWYDEKVRFAQMNNLKMLDNGLWVAGLRAPQAIVTSKDLRRWYLVYAEGFDNRFNLYMSISEGKEFIACSTGKSLLLFKKDKLQELIARTQPIMITYKAWLDKLRGLGFILKRKI